MIFLVYPTGKAYVGRTRSSDEKNILLPKNLFNAKACRMKQVEIKVNVLSDLWRQNSGQSNLPAALNV